MEAPQLGYAAIAQGHDGAFQDAAPVFIVTPRLNEIDTLIAALTPDATTLFYLQELASNRTGVVRTTKHTTPSGTSRHPAVGVSVQYTQPVFLLGGFCNKQGELILNGVDQRNTLYAGFSTRKPLGEDAQPRDLQQWVASPDMVVVAPEDMRTLPKERIVGLLLSDDLEGLTVKYNGQLRLDLDKTACEWLRGLGMTRLPWEPVGQRIENVELTVVRSGVEKVHAL